MTVDIIIQISNVISINWCGTTRILCYMRIPIFMYTLTLTLFAIMSHNWTGTFPKWLFLNVYYGHLWKVDYLNNGWNSIKILFLYKQIISNLSLYGSKIILRNLTLCWGYEFLIDDSLQTYYFENCKIAREPFIYFT